MMAAGLNCLFSLVFEVIVYINICSALSHDHENYNNALKQNRGKLSNLLSGYHQGQIQSFGLTKK